MRTRRTTAKRARPRRRFNPNACGKAASAGSSPVSGKSSTSAIFRQQGADAGIELQRIPISLLRKDTAQLVDGALQEEVVAEGIDLRGNDEIANDLHDRGAISVSVSHGHDLASFGMAWTDYGTNYSAAAKMA